MNYSQVHKLLQGSEKDSLDRLGARIFSVDALAKTIKGLDVLDSRSAAKYDIAVFFEPSAIDDRIVNQFAYFSAISNPQMAFDDWLQKPHVRRSVDAVKRVLMTGLDGLCSWLKRHYKPMH